MLNSGLLKPPVAPKPKNAQSPQPGLSPATPRREGLSHPSPATTRKPKPVLAPKPNLSKVTASGSPGPNKRLVTGANGTVGLLNSQNGLQQENKGPNWDYIIPICFCSKEKCNCIKNEAVSRIEKGRITPNISKAETEQKKDVSKNIEDIKELESLTSQNTSQSDSIVKSSNDRVNKTIKPSQEVLALYQNFHTVDNIYTPTLTNGQPPPQKVHEEAAVNVTSQTAPGLEPKQEKLCPPSISIQKNPPIKKPAPVPPPRKSQTPAVAQQEKVEEQIVSQTASEVKSVPSISVSTPASTRPKHPPRILKPTCAPPAPPPQYKPILSHIGKSFSSEDVEEEDLGLDVPEVELSVDESNDEVKKEEAAVNEPIYLTADPPDCLVLERPEDEVKAPPKPVRGKSTMLSVQSAGSFEAEDNNDRAPRNRDAQLLQETSMRQQPLQVDEKTPTGATGTMKSSSLKSKAKSFSGIDTLRPQKPRKNSFQRFLDLKLAVKKKWMSKGGQAQESSDSEQDYEDEIAQGLKGERKLSCPLLEHTVGPFPPAPEPEDYYEDIPVYEEIGPDYMNVNVDGDSSAPDEETHPSTTANEDEEDLYEIQEPYIKMERRSPLPEEIYNTPRSYNLLNTDDGGLSDEEIRRSTTDEEEAQQDSFDTSSVSSRDGEPEQTATKSATLIRKKDKIRNIANEIMTSEKVFVGVLKLLHVDFRNAVHEASRQKGTPVIEDRLLDQILYYLPQLYELNQELLKELQHRVDTWEDNSKVADIFVKKGAFLKMYSNYIREFDKNVALLEEQTKKNLAFAAVVREFEARPSCANLALRHYLLKPVQRIPQYQLLLTDYLKNLPEDSLDYRDTQDALIIVKEVACHANDIMKQGDVFQKLMQVQCRLIGNHELVQPGRVFLKEGIVNKLSRKTLQPRMIFLFNDMLLYTTPVQTGQFKVKQKLSLAGMKVRKPNQDAFQNELTIESVERSFICSTSSAVERDEWVEALESAIDDNIKKMTSFVPETKVELSSAIGFKAPPWIPDKRVTMCMICAWEFTLTWRRHHCRGCGWVVCQSCSSNKYPLKYLKDDNARVCNQCFLALQKQKNVNAISSTVSSRHTLFNPRLKKIPACRKEVAANTINSTMSGYLYRMKSKEKAKKKWFVIKEKILYTYAASEDVVALETLPLLGFTVQLDSDIQFRLLHKDILYYVFKANDELSAMRWVDAMNEACVLQS